MGLETQAVLKGHLTVPEICTLLRTECRAINAVARPMRSRDHWIIGFVDHNGQSRSIDVFQNSFAADDYRELGVAESTFLSMEFSADSESFLQSIATPSGGWVRRHDGLPWSELAAASAQEVETGTRH
jgi:hypothetical protein